MGFASPPVPPEKSGGAGDRKNCHNRGKNGGGNEYEQKRDVSSLFEPVLNDIPRPAGKILSCVLRSEPAHRIHDFLS